MFIRTDFNDLNTFFIVKEAQERGYIVKKLFPDSKNSALQVTHPDGREVFVICQRAANLSYISYYACKYKHITKKFLRDNNISISQGKTFTKDMGFEALIYFNSMPKPVVIKPTQGTWGHDVFLNVTAKDQAKEIIRKLVDRGATFLIEEQSAGDEYRILATRNEVLGIIHRIPANIIGNGKDTIKNLVAEKNLDERRNDDHGSALITIKLDEIAKKILTNQSLTVDSIPTNGQRILLRDNSNISTGGDSIDYTDLAHPKVNELALKIIRAIPELPYAGFDFLTPDITKDPLEVGYTVIEINDSPMISMHHEPYEGTKRNVASKIVDLYFK